MCGNEIILAVCCSQRRIKGETVYGKRVAVCCSELRNGLQGYIYIYVYIYMCIDICM